MLQADRSVSKSSQAIARGAVHKCGACLAALGSICATIAPLLDARVPEVGDENIATWRPLRGNSKNRRVEQAVKDYLLVGTVRAGSAANGQEAMRAHGVCLTTGQRWMSQQVANYIAGSWHLPELHRLGTVGMVQDSARFGQPAKETMVAALSFSGGGFGVWLPPQETRAMAHPLLLSVPSQSNMGS